MSRDMKSSEIDAFEAKYGYKPVLLPAAIDMLAVYVHRIIRSSVLRCRNSTRCILRIAKGAFLAPFVNGAIPRSV